jgi:type II secretory pathway predicted ATPase ExeA
VFILILDEAQDIPVQTLLALLQFSDAMQTASERLVQMVFLGQPKFAQQLQLPELQPLRQALELQVTIEPLTDAESRVYIQKSLEGAVVPADAELTDERLCQIIEHQGYPARHQHALYGGSAPCPGPATAFAGRGTARLSIWGRTPDGHCKRAPP